MSVRRELSDGRYVLDDEPIASGGMGTVWRGFDRTLRRAVAVKELRFPEGLSESERDQLRARAMIEARAAAGLDHPGIVAVHDVIEEDGRPWIVMRLISGRSLAQEVEASGPLSPRRAAEVGLQILDALAAAHTQGVLHRDVKPQNVLLDADGKAVLSDFGIASVAGIDRPITRPMTETGLVVGTLGYVAPERLSGADPGPESDLWSLGATVYFAVEGRPAYDTGGIVTTIAAIVTRAPEPTRRAGPLGPVIAGLLARDVDVRLNAVAARERLQAVASGRPTFEHATEVLPEPDAPTRTVPSPPPGQGGLPAESESSGSAEHAQSAVSAASADRPFSQRRWAVPVALGAAAAVLVGGGIAVGVLLGDRETPRARSTPPPAANRFTAAPAVCESNVLPESVIEPLIHSPRPGPSSNSGPTARCAWQDSDEQPDGDQQELDVRVTIHASSRVAAELFKEPTEADESSESKETTRPRIGDQAELVTANTETSARIRISNLTIEIDYYDNSGVGMHTKSDEVMDVVRQIVAVAEAEGK